MLYMVIERFRQGCEKAVYERAGTYGRMLPEGLEYLDSWVTTDLKTCYEQRHSAAQKYRDCPLINSTRSAE